MILASASPRRKELLERAGFELLVEPADIDETRQDGESPLALVERLATQKAHASLRAHGSLAPKEILLAADTIVWMGDEVLGKPADEDDAGRMLHALSGKTHHVSTGVCLLVGQETGDPIQRAFVQTTDVAFRILTDVQIRDYIATGEPMDKAGAYAIQGGAGAFVERYEGDYDNVVGLPVARVLSELEALLRADKPQSVTQIPGVFAGHATNAEAGTGCTVIVCPEGAIGGVDVRGGAPATRETDLLRPEETVQIVHAVVLSGGSAYGLAASCGVAEELERAGIGIDVGVGTVPIVSGACLFDLGVGDAHVRPTAADGAAAVRAALAERATGASARTPLARGNVGAGTGCSVGKWEGPLRAMKTGLGEDVQVVGELVCGAVVAVNACGDVRDPRTNELIAGLRSEDGTRIQGSAEAILRAAEAPLVLRRTNTTISCVVTNAKLNQAEATKVAQMAADAYAHAIDPVHTTVDGDAVFVMATGEVEAQVDVVGIVATRALERAIVDAALQAAPAYGLPTARG